MIPNSLIGSSQSVLPQLGDASLSAPVAHRIPRHALGPCNAVDASVGPFARSSASAPNVRPIVTPSNDALGIIASYLPQNDQLAMRRMNKSAYKIVDSTVQSLKLTTREACTVLRQPNALRNLRELHLILCKDDALIELATILSKMRKTDFELIVPGSRYGKGVTVDGIRPLMDVRLSRLTLRDMTVHEDMRAVLDSSVSPLSIDLGHVYEDVDIDAISRLRQLHSLKVGVNLTLATLVALGSHQALETLSLQTVSESGVRVLAASAHIRTLSIGRIYDGEAAALSALAANKVLTSLAVAVADGRSLEALSRNATIQNLSVQVSDGPKSFLGLLATMPSLACFCFGPRDYEHVSVTGDDIQALCEKPLKALSIYRIKLDSAARSLLANAKIARVLLQR